MEPQFLLQQSHNLVIIHLAQKINQQKMQMSLTILALAF